MIFALISVGVFFENWFGNYVFVYFYCHNITREWNGWIFLYSLRPEARQETIVLSFLYFHRPVSVHRTWNLYHHHVEVYTSFYFRFSYVLLRIRCYPPANRDWWCLISCVITKNSHSISTIFFGTLLVVKNTFFVFYILFFFENNFNMRIPLKIHFLNK